MNHELASSAGIIALTILLSACAGSRPAGVTTNEGRLAEPPVPAGYVKIPPRPANTSAAMLSQTATIFRGVLKRVTFTYDDCAGPRTNYEFDDVSVLLGAQIRPQVTVSAFGGPTPRGTWLKISEQPQLALDSEYVVFLRNTDWTYSPIVGNLVFRREMIGSREVLVEPGGRAVTGWAEDGPVLSAGQVSEEVGTRLHSYRRFQPAPGVLYPTSVNTDSNPVVKPAGGGAVPPAPGRTGGSAIAGAPSAVEIKKAGYFERPAVSGAAIAGVPTLTAEGLAAAVRRAAAQAQVTIGGRIALDPYWRCTNATPTVRAGR